MIVPAGADARRDTPSPTITGSLPILVLGERAAVAVPACRALARAGFTVGVAGRRQREDAAWSRYVRRYHRLPPGAEGGGAWADAIGALIEAEGYAAVVATTDRMVARLMTTPLGVPTVPTIGEAQRALVDKEALATLAAAVDVPYPRTLSVSEATEDGLVDALGLPLIVKAAVPASVGDDGAVRKLGGAVLVRDPRRLSGTASAIRAQGLRPIAQARVDGAKHQVTIIRRGGRTSLAFAMRVAREYPRHRGSESMLEAIPTDRGIGLAMVAALARVVDGAAYEGVVGAEFLVPESGAAVLLDVNPRLTGSLAFAEALGLRMAEAAVRDALGLPPPPAGRDVSGRRYHHLTRELRWYLAERPPLRRHLKSFGPSDVWDVPAFGDPLPGLARVTRRLRGVLAGLTNRRRTGARGPA